MIKSTTLIAALTLPLMGMAQTADSVIRTQIEIVISPAEPDIILDEPDTSDDASDENNGLTISIGGLIFMEHMDFLNDGFMPIESGHWAMGAGQAQRVAVNFRKQDRLGKSSFWLRRGLGFSTYVMDFGPDHYLWLMEGPYPGVGFMQSQHELMSSTFSVSYLELPLSLVYNGSASGNKGLSLAVGGFAGLRTGAKTESIRRSDAGWMKHTMKNGHYTSRFAFGTQMEIGYKKYFLSSRMNLNPFFIQRDDLITPSLMAATLSVGMHL